MKNKELIIGCHVKMKAPNYLVDSLKDAVNYNANAFMIYTGPPQSSKRKAIAALNIEKFQELLQHYNIPITNIIAHAPYIINLANAKNPDSYEWAITFLQEEIKRCEAIGIKILVLHPGSAVKTEKEVALNQIVTGINKACFAEQKVKIAIETMSGKGSEIGSNFEELAYIIKNVERKDLIGVCWDTCHLYDAGYDIVNKLDEVIKLFDEKIGLDKLLLLHINDSKFGFNSHKDRHANFGFGEIGFMSLMKIIYHPLFKNKVKILETPWVGNKPPYALEIKMILEQKFDEHLLAKLEMDNS